MILSEKINKERLTMTLSEALSYFKNKSALARAIGVHPNTVQNWDVRGGIPQLRQMQIELEITKIKRKLTMKQKKVK